MLSQLTFVDYSIILILIASIVVGLIRGFLKEALSLVTWVGSVWVAYAFRQTLSVALAGFIENGTLRMGLSTLGLFLVTLAIGMSLSYLIAKCFRRAKLTSSDRCLGLLFGAARGYLLVALLGIGMGFTSLVTSSSWKKSVFVPYVAPVITFLTEEVPGYLHKQGKKQLKTSKQKANDTLDDALA